MIKEEEIEAYVSSGNIFNDLDHPNAEEAQEKSDLAMQIYKVIKQKEIAENEVTNLLGIDQPKVSDIIRGKLSKYSINKLMRLLRLLGDK